MIDIHQWLNTVAALISILGILYIGGWRLGQLQLKVDTMWMFQVNRMQSEAVIAGVAKVNSPITVSDEAKKWMTPLVAPIRDFYAKLGRRMSDAELMLEIERRFGDQILRDVCIPHGLAHGACLLIALQAIRDPNIKETEN